MRRRQRRRRRRSQHSVGRQDPASGVQEAEEEHPNKRRQVIHGGEGVLSRIFLSYSRSQLDFVKKVCKDLEDHHRFPFLDIRHSSLALGEKFEEPLLKAAQQCRLAVVVVSEEYFSSEWPMRELVEFMRAKSGSNPNLKILPLFFKLSIRDLHDEAKQERWLAEWAKWAEAGLFRVNVAEYKKAFAEVKACNGHQFNQDMMELGSYEKEVVRGICELVSPDIKLYDEHVKGISNMYEDYIDKIQRVRPSEPSGTCGVRVIGYYGVGGIGKTTMCKNLCNELSKEFEDKVCHVELAPSLSSSEKLSHLKEVLKKLTSTNDELLQQLNEDQCKHLLCKSSSWKQKAFLALDNVWDDTSLIDFVTMFIRNAGFHDGSVVMVTARSLTTLSRLGLERAQCFEVPELSMVDARSLFLFHVVGGRPFDSEDDTNMIDECVARCHFKKGGNQGSHYLPLALKVLGIHLGGLGKTPQQWLDNLPKARDFGLHYPEDNPVFGVIRLNYDRLSREDQELFMDLTVFLSLGSLRMWLGLVHRKSLEAIEDQLQHLKEKGLLEEFDLTTGNFSMHDLYREFAVWESQGRSNREGFDNQRWMYEYNSHLSNLETTPAGGVWQNLIRVRIEEEHPLLNPSEDYGNLSLQGIQWRYCSNVVVLKLVGLENLRGVLNLKDLYCLRSLELFRLLQLDGVEGLEDLKHLTYIEWCTGGLYFFAPKEDRQLGQLPASLKILLVLGHLALKLGRHTFSRCTKLCNLMLEGVEASDGIGFDHCTSLASLELRRVSGPGFLASEEVLDLHKFTRLQVLEINTCDNISKVCGLDNLRQLRELRLEKLKELSSISELQNLNYLALPFCSLGRTVDLGTVGLPFLQHLDLHGSSLEVLPDLSKMTALEELDVGGSFIELQEEDIDMLAELPKLLFVQLGSNFAQMTLDIVRRRVKYRLISYIGVCGESDLGILPVSVRDVPYRCFLSRRISLGPLRRFFEPNNFFRSFASVLEGKEFD